MVVVHLSRFGAKHHVGVLVLRLSVLVHPVWTEALLEVSMRTVIALSLGRNHILGVEAVPFLLSTIVVLVVLGARRLLDEHSLLRVATLAVAFDGVFLGADHVIAIGVHRVSLGDVNGQVLLLAKSLLLLPTVRLEGNLVLGDLVAQSFVLNEPVVERAIRDELVTFCIAWFVNANVLVRASNH